MSLELCKGIAVIIDDKIKTKPGEQDDHIVKIVKKIEENGVPYCGYSKLSDAHKVINNLGAVNFLVLDWDLQGDLDSEDAEEVIKPSNSNRVIKFIKDFKEVCFCPIFIFSNAAVADIKDKLKTEKLYDEERNNFIYVHAKKDLIGGKKLIRAIEKWVNSNPTIYTLKNWEGAFLTAKNSTFWHLFEKSPLWPKVLWESYDEDSVDPHTNLNDVIYRLVKSRTSLIKLDEKRIKKRGKVDVEEVKDVIQGTMYLDKKNIGDTDLQPGDIFKKHGNYYINIRPECDTIIEREGYDGKIYLLKGSKLSAAQFKKKHYHRKYGLQRKHNNFLLYGLEGKDFVHFNLNEVIVAEHAEYATSRLCRLLSPYINDVQQQYSSYVGRFGLPRIPNRVLSSIG